MTNLNGRKLLAVLLTVAIVATLLPVFVRTTDAVGLTSGDCSGQGTSVAYNYGKQGTVCTALSDMASAYYTGSYTYSTLSGLSGSATSTTSSALYTTLSSLMTNTHTNITSYEALKTNYAKADCENGSTTTLRLFYCGDTVSSTWDGGTTFNREHIWPKSLASFVESNGGADLHHLRPSDSTVNSTRSNLPYGEVTDGTAVYRGGSGSGGSLAGYKNSNYYEPLDGVKGDAARILLYVYVRWGEANLTDVIQSVDVLLSWIELDPVDTWEMGRNDATETIQGNRNVFIDYPELAFTLFGESVPSGYQTPTSNGTTPTSTATETATATPVTTTSPSSDTYTKVTSELSDWSGEYLIVYEAGSYAFDSTLTTLDAVNDYKAVTITNDTITLADAPYFTIASSGTSYTILARNGQYIGRSADSNGLDTSSTAINNTISYNSTDGCININGVGGAYLRFNSASNQMRFRYYKSSTYTSQQAIQLYKRVVTATPTPVTSETATPTPVVTATPTPTPTPTATATPETEVNTYELVTDASTLAADDVIVIAGLYSTNSSLYGLNSTQNSNNRGATVIVSDVSALPETITISSDLGIQELTLGGNATDHWSLYTGAGYLYAASSSSNWLRTQTTNTANGLWAVSITDGVASIIAQGSYTRNDMRFNYNGGAPMFSCYASTTTTLTVSIYRKVENSGELYSVTYSSNDGGKLSVVSGETSVSNGAGLASGTVLTITATPDDGYALESLTVNGEAFTSGGTYTVTANTVIAASFTAVATYTINWKTPENGTLTVLCGEPDIASGDSVLIGSELTITATPDSGYYCSVLTVNETDFTSGETYTVTADVDIVVNFELDITTAYELVTDLSTLAANDTVIIVGASTDSETGEISLFAAQPFAGGNNLPAGTIGGGYTDMPTTLDVPVSANAQAFTLGSGVTNAAYWSFFDGTGYLAATSSGSNRLQVNAELSVDSEWEISLTDGLFSVVATGSPNRNVMQYNIASKLFSCYTSASQSAVYIYRLPAVTTFTVTYQQRNAVTGELAEVVSYTVNSGSTLSEIAALPTIAGCYVSDWDQDLTGVAISEDVTVTCDYALWGDANLDGVLTVSDATVMLNHIVGASGAALTGIAFAVSDVNGDGSITVVDVTLLLQRVVGTITAFPVEQTE